MAVPLRRPPLPLGGTLGPCYGTHSICCYCSHCEQLASAAVPTGEATGPARCSLAPGGVIGTNPEKLPVESKMFANERCSKIGCFLEGALPVIAPAVALVSMLSIFAFACC